MLAIKRQEQVAYQAMLNDPALRRQVKEMKRQKGESKEEKRERKRREKEVRLRHFAHNSAQTDHAHAWQLIFDLSETWCGVLSPLRTRRPPRRKKNIPVIRIIITIDTTADLVIRTMNMVHGRTSAIGTTIDVPSDRVRDRGPRLLVETTGIGTYVIGRTPRSTIRVIGIIDSLGVRTGVMGGTNGIVQGQRRIDEEGADRGPGPGMGAVAGE
jgi:hypothetical protein